MQFYLWIQFYLCCKHPGLTGAGRFETINVPMQMRQICNPPDRV